MTRKEAECFRALRRWQRAYLRKKLKYALIPRLPFKKRYERNGVIGKCSLFIFSIFLFPIFFLFWLARVIRASVIFPFLTLSTYFKPSDLRAPGERNLKGVHYQFARHIDLPPDLYVQCVDDWVRALYGYEKLPKYSLSNYLDAEYLKRRQLAYDDDASLRSLIASQISNAREDLSRDLGHY